LGSHKRRRGRLLDRLGRRRSRLPAGLRSGICECQAQVREQLLEVTQQLPVDLPLERPEQGGDSVDRQPGLVELTAVELRVGELPERSRE
jgi:hypothetical protein